MQDEGVLVDVRNAVGAQQPLCQRLQDGRELGGDHVPEQEQAASARLTHLVVVRQHRGHGLGSHVGAAAREYHVVDADDDTRAVLRCDDRARQNQGELRRDALELGQPIGHRMADENGRLV